MITVNAESGSTVNIYESGSDEVGASGAEGDHETKDTKDTKESKKSDTKWSGRSPQNIVAVFPKESYEIGDFVMVKINDCTSATLIGEAIGLSENN